MDASKFFIDRPIFAGVLSILIFVSGLIAIPQLPISEYPDVVPPSVQVTALYPGADPKTISETVAAPIEEAVNGVENMTYMKSAAGSDGTMSLTVTFKQGTDIDQAAVRVQNRVQQALPRLPETVRSLGVTTAKSSPNITMVVHLTSPNKTYDSLYLSNFANLRVKDDLARLDGVGQALAFGAGNYAMRIWLDPQKAAARNLTATDIISAIREQNVQVSAGSIGAAPQPDGAPLQLSINAQGRLTTAEQFGDIVLKSQGSALTRLKDIARIELGSQTYALHSLLNNEDAAAIVIFQAPGANSIALSDAVRQRMAELAKTFPKDVQWTVAFDPTVFVRESIKSVIETLLEAILLVVIVVVVFLQTWRASIIPLLAVPVSVVGTFAVLWLLGFSINVLTLFGLVLAIGIVVDDAIVVVENVERNISDGLKPLAAAHKAMSEVSGPIIAISLVLVAVFVPLAFLDGVTGQFYRQFAVTIAISAVISAINSLTLSPALAAVLLKPHDAKPDRLGRLIDSMLGGFFHRFNAKFRRAGDRYGKAVQGNMTHSVRLMILYAGLIGIAFLAFRSVPGGFIPTQDKQYLFALVQLPEGATLDRTDAMVRKLSTIALNTPGVHNTVEFPGLNAVHFIATPNTAVIFIGLDPAKERKKSAAEIASIITGQFAQIQDGLAFAVMPPPVLGLGNSAGAELYVQDRGGLGYGELNAQTQALAGILRQSPGFNPYAVYSTNQANVPQLSAEVDRTKAKEKGVNLYELYNTLQVYLGSTYVNDFNLFGRTYNVYAQADARFRDEVSDIAQLRTRSNSGEMVAVGSVVNIKESYGPDPVIRYNGFPSADLSAGSNSAVMSSSQAIAAIRQLADTNLPNGLAIEWTGLSYEQIHQGNAAFWVFPLCILLVYLVLSALYESWSLPLTVILIVPLCIFSAIGGIWLVNFFHGLSFIFWPPTYAPSFLDNNVFTQIGLVVLMGLACKNAILIVEFARELELQGRSTLDAAFEACRLRLRPILMTSFAFIMGVTPLVFATGAGAEVRQVMGVTVFAGMLGVTLFGLFFTPLFYVLIRHWSARREANPKQMGDAHEIQ
jgi:hydrophobe/amphiphile efflux-1 (HAE1) family protein